MGNVDLGNLGTEHIRGGKSEPRTPEGPRGGSANRTPTPKPTQAPTPSPGPTPAPAPTATPSPTPTQLPDWAKKLVDELKVKTSDIEKLSQGDWDGVSKETKESLQKAAINHLQGRSSYGFTVGDRKFEVYKNHDGTIGATMTIPLNTGK